MAKQINCRYARQLGPEMSLSPSGRTKLRRENRLGRILVDDDLKRELPTFVLLLPVDCGHHHDALQPAHARFTFWILFVGTTCSHHPLGMQLRPFNSLFLFPSYHFLLIRVLPKSPRCFRSPPPPRHFATWR